MYEKYLTLARDAHSAGDRVAAEAYFQHAEHYYRILSDSTDPQRPDRRQDDRQPNQPQAAETTGGDAGSTYQVNGDTGASSPQPEPVAESSDAQANGHSDETAGQEPQAGQDKAPVDDQKPAAPKRRGRPRKPRPSQQDASSDKDGSAAEPALSAPTPVEPTPSDS